jgi:HEAT repeat protein
VEDLLVKAEKEDRGVIDLGTPQIVDTKQLLALIEIGRAAAPTLVAATRSASPRRVAYAVHALGRIGDPTAVAAIEAVQARFAGRLPEDPWEAAAVAQAHAALAALRE